MRYEPRWDVQQSGAADDLYAVAFVSPLVGWAHYRAAEALLADKQPDAAIKRLTIFRDQGPYQNQPGLSDRALLRLGYAYAASGYHQGGVAVTAAAEDSERVRRIFVAEFGAPRRTYLHGQSWGASVAAKAARSPPSLVTPRKANAGAVVVGVAVAL